MNNPSLKEGFIALLIVLGVVFIGDVINRSPIPENLKTYAIIIGAVSFGYTAIYLVSKNAHRF